MKESLKIITKSAAETKKLGEKLAREIVLSPDGSRTSIKEALVISLEGELGAGKTTFTQGFAKGLGVKENPRSPTFVIMRVYPIRKRVSNFIHIDAYRIASKDMKALGWNEFSRKPGNIILIEWGNRIKNILPKNSLVISFGHIGHFKKRLIKINQ
ncbi:MAG: tRNA (adenosine(37)-N6)-threonylcarbamoyltransferase complex ATPase subunit type 1 TsaE [bacterium]|nr:tRNA (adenosine(37)-N6)-threonylcarbamoyltransferase complex ATPase subunit type 1 TsaE [bacterium]